MANVGNGSRAIVIEVCFSFNFPVVFYFNLFPVPPSIAKSIGDVLTTNGQLVTCFFLSILQRALPIDASNRPALLGNARWTGKNYRRSKLRPCCLLAQGASPIIQKKNSNRSRIIWCVFPIHGDIALLGGNGNTLKIKTTAKLNSKQTSIATVRDLYWMYATFLTPLGSHYNLPLMYRYTLYVWQNHLPNDYSVEFPKYSRELFF